MAYNAQMLYADVRNYFPFLWLKCFRSEKISNFSRVVHKTTTSTYGKYFCIGRYLSCRWKYDYSTDKYLVNHFPHLKHCQWLSLVALKRQNFRPFFQIVLNVHLFGMERRTKHYSESVVAMSMKHHSVFHSIATASL